MKGRSCLPKRVTRQFLFGASKWLEKVTRLGLRVIVGYKGFQARFTNEHTVKSSRHSGSVIGGAVEVQFQIMNCEKNR